MSAAIGLGGGARGPMVADELFLRFAADHTDGVDVVLIGTRHVTRLTHAVECVARGPLAPDVLHAIAPALSRCDLPSLV